MITRWSIATSFAPTLSSSTRRRSVARMSMGRHSSSSAACTGARTALGWKFAANSAKRFAKSSLRVAPKSPGVSRPIRISPGQPPYCRPETARHRGFGHIQVNDDLSSRRLLRTEEVGLSRGICGVEDQATKAETISRVQCFELVVAGMPTRR